MQNRNSSARTAAKYSSKCSLFIRQIPILTILMFAAVFLSSCDNAGVTEERLNGNENDLPQRLKGLKIYSVSIGKGSYVKVAVLDNKVNSTTYKVGKIHESLIIVDNSGKQIKVSQILSENDSVIVCRK